MATFEEVGEEFAEAIRNAAKADKAARRTRLAESTEKTASAKGEFIKQASVSATLSALEERLTSELTVNGQPLTVEQQLRIIKAAAEKLKLRDPRKLRLMMKEASNDNFVGLVAYWDDFFAELGL